MFHNNESDPVIFEERRWGEGPGWTERPLSGSGNGSRSGVVIVAPQGQPKPLRPYTLILDFVPTGEYVPH